MISHRSSERGSWWLRILTLVDGFLLRPLYWLAAGCFTVIASVLIGVMLMVMILIGLSLRLLRSSVRTAIRGLQMTRLSTRPGVRQSRAAAHKATTAIGDEMTKPQMDDMKVNQMSDGRSMLMANGMPVLIELHMRPASSAPEGTRIKCALVANTMNGDDEQVVPLPYAVPVMPNEMKAGEGGYKPVRPSGFTPEFRYEMN